MPQKKSGQQKRSEKIDEWIARRKKTAGGMGAHVKELARRNNLAYTPRDSKHLQRVVSEYVVVKLSALLQSAFKSVIQNVVDSWDLKHELDSDFTFSFSIATLQGLNNKKWSLGQCVCFWLSINSYEDMTNYFKKVTGKKFADILRDVPESNIIVKVDETVIKMISDDLERLFHKRNILCHELSVEKLITQEDITDWIYVTVPVIQALEFYESEYLSRRAESKGINGNGENHPGLN